MCEFENIKKTGIRLKVTVDRPNTIIKPVNPPPRDPHDPANKKKLVAPTGKVKFTKKATPATPKSPKTPKGGKTPKK